jgi:hypothetical protein
MGNGFSLGTGIQRVRGRSGRLVGSLLVAAGLGLGSLAAQAACNYPAEVPVPDGKTATEAEMNAAGQAVKQYMAEMEAYLACLDAEHAALPPEQQTPEAKSLTVKRHNAAVDSMESLAARFNEQVRAYKSARR